MSLQSGTRIGPHDVVARLGAPAKVFGDPFHFDTGGAAGGMANCDIAPDGKRFVMVEEPKAPAAATTRLNVVLNRGDELKRRVPIQ